MGEGWVESESKVSEELFNEHFLKLQFGHFPGQMRGKFVAILFCLMSGYPKLTPYVPKMESKLTSSFLSRNFHELPCPLVAAFKTFPVVS